LLFTEHLKSETLSSNASSHQIRITTALNKTDSTLPTARQSSVVFVAEVAVTAGKVIVRQVENSHVSFRHRAAQKHTKANFTRQR
jgi:hypothetical protein